MKNPIFVTGSHRSGSTWVGRMLSVSATVGYIHEPFNLDCRWSPNPKPFEYWFEHIPPDYEGEYNELFKKLLAFKYPVASNLKRVECVRDIALIVKRYMFYRAYATVSARPLVKDPIALFSAEWFARQLHTKNVIVIRHPAAFCSSILLKKWNFDFNCFLSQPLLMEGYLASYEEEIRHAAEKKMSLLNQSILMWNCFHHVINFYENKYSHWCFVKHEDLSLDPVGEFKVLYEKLGIPFSKKVESVIEKSSGNNNPVEQVPGRELVRNSKQNILNWKTRLATDEIKTIKDGTFDIWKHWYSNDDW